MKILVATKETQGQRPDDFYAAQEGEIVMPDDCDNLHEGSECACQRSVIGVQSGEQTTTMRVVDESLTHVEYRQQLAEAIECSEVPEAVEDVAVRLQAVAEQFPVGAIIERRAGEFQARLSEKR